MNGLLYWPQWSYANGEKMVIKEILTLNTTTLPQNLGCVLRSDFCPQSTAIPNPSFFIKSKDKPLGLEKYIYINVYT